jgi:hypothetical protein
MCPALVNSFFQKKWWTSGTIDRNAPRMKIVLKEIPTMTIEQFAERNELLMEIYERITPSSRSMRYFAHFRNAEVKDGEMLIGSFGNGATPEEAITNYALAISMKLLVIYEASKQVREIQVPRLIED